MSVLYPEIEPYMQGMLDVGDDIHIYWETCGHPEGKPVVVLHGGPGSGCTPNLRRYFDPAAYRVILFDQRQCGRSLPHASDPSTDLSVNTTEHLLADMERLRQHLNVERWMVFGGSWGCTLALAYAQRFPEQVTEIVVFGVTTTRKSEIDWLYRGLAPLFPEQWFRFRDGVPVAERDGDLVAAYYRLLAHPKAEVRAQAAKDWHDWEAATLALQPDAKPNPRWSDPDYRMARARIVTHYFHHCGWLEEGILLRNAGKLASIPGMMVQGRLDLEAPLTTAWELAQVWSGSELVIVERAGHSPNDAGMAEAIIAATDRFARTGW